MGEFERADRAKRVLLSIIDTLNEGLKFNKYGISLTRPEKTVEELSTDKLLKIDEFLMKLHWVLEEEYKG